MAVVAVPEDCVLLICERRHGIQVSPLPTPPAPLPQPATLSGAAPSRPKTSHMLKACGACGATITATGYYAAAGESGLPSDTGS